MKGGEIMIREDVVFKCVGCGGLLVSNIDTSNGAMCPTCGTWVFIPTECYPINLASNLTNRQETRLGNRRE